MSRLKSQIEQLAMEIQQAISTSPITTTKNTKYNTLPHQIEILIKTKNQGLQKARQIMESHDKGEGIRLTNEIKKERGHQRNER